MSKKKSPSKGKQKVGKSNLLLKKRVISGLYRFTTAKAWLEPMRPSNSPLPERPQTPLPSMPIPVRIPPTLKTIPTKPIPLKLYWEELRLDVDGKYPQMQASGKLRSLFHDICWVASIKKTGTNIYEGKIWYAHGTPLFRFTSIKISVTWNLLMNPQQAVVTFSGSGLVSRSMVFKYHSPYFHDVEFEFDYEEGITPVIEIGTHDHPNRPSTLVNEKLSINTVFKRAGFNVTNTNKVSQIPSNSAGTNTQWSDNEMHDAMQTYWSKNANKAQWSLWTLFARQHEEGNTLGGVMFDEIGPNHRQGTAIFYDSFISERPTSNADAFVARMRFWTAVHEMGHAFNMAHSWQKEMGDQWIPNLTDEDEARSFMNYPYRVNGEEATFFSNFQYRFSDQELLFLRHAPSEFVQMGNAAWFDNHGFEWTKSEIAHGLELVVRTNKQVAEFEFLEPVCVELKLKNVSTQPIGIEDKVLEDAHCVTIIVKRENKEARVFRPFANPCFKSKNESLQPGNSKYGTHFISAGIGQWYIDEPGYYQLQACVKTENGYVVSNIFRIRVTPPSHYDQSLIAQDYFSDDVGRVLQFDGSVAMAGANNTLQLVTDKLVKSNAAVHANIALAIPKSRGFKQMEFSKNKFQINVAQPNISEAKKFFSRVFGDDAPGKLTSSLSNNLASLGHIDSERYIQQFAKMLLAAGGKEEARTALGAVLQQFVNKGVIKPVCNRLDAQLKAI